MSTPTAGLSLQPFRALRPAVNADRLGRLLCPPYDVIDAAGRTALLAGDPDNAVRLVLPDTSAGADGYRLAAEQLTAGVASGLYAVDAEPALYVYEMAEPGGAVTRGLLGAVELRDPADGVILPHENTMAGPVADRLALMAATESNLEPIYLAYDGGGAASRAVSEADRLPVLAHARTPDGITHRLWALTDPDLHVRIAADLAGRRALIADGHHRYATYRRLQQDLRAERGPGPWDRGLTLLVDTSSYGPQVHAIHRVLTGISLADAAERVAGYAALTPVAGPQEGLARAAAQSGFAAVLCAADRCLLLTDPEGRLAAAAAEPGALPALARLDVTVLHRGLVGAVLGLADSEEQVGYAHSVDEAIEAARRSAGTAVLLRPTPVDAVAAVAAAGGRMPRKSTLFTPKPASGLVMRRFADEPAGR